MKIERQLQGTLNTVFTELIKEKGLEGKIQPYPSQEEHRADITLKDKNGKPIFFIELKDPTAKDGKSVFDNNILMREVERAQRLEIKYFGNCNFLACAFFDKDKLYEKVGVHEGFFTLHDISRLSVSFVPTKEILKKLRSIGEYYIARALEIIERKPIKFSEVDELFIFKIRKLIEVYAQPVSEKVWEMYRSDKSFEKKIQIYTQSQLWNKPSTFEEIENLTHISLLMLISKLIFYKTYVDNQFWHELHPIKVTDDVETPVDLENLIWLYFEEFKEITHNFELLIGERSDIIFQIPFVSDAIIDLVKYVLDTGGHYNFSKIPFDIIGRIFEDLIREDERHKLGQYFTPSYVIDLINAFAINSEKDKVFDPSCGSGTFLIRAYDRKKELSKSKVSATTHHEILLSEIYGNDLSGYPAYLSMLNLAIRNTRRASYPLIINKDFFSITAGTKIELHNRQGVKEKELLPKFDAIIGNPPYTRQEDIGAMHGTVVKSKIQGIIKSECGFEPSQRTSIYAYFFYHAATFLKDDGYLAYICQNSWLETNYGIDLQRYLLNNYEIVAIMDSEVERFFPTASVNTTIVILKRQKDEDKRNNNIVKFVYLTAPLQEVIKNHKNADNLKEIIKDANKNITTDYFRINCILQESLLKHTKWTKFLKAPKVYFDIINKGHFEPLKDHVKNVKFGIKTGCNDFFILKDITNVSKSSHLITAVNHKKYLDSMAEVKRRKLRLVENGFKEFWLIESQYLEPMLTSPKDVANYSVSFKELRFMILNVHAEKKLLREKSPFIYEYIKYGERIDIHLASSLKSRNLWYDIGQRIIPDMSFNYMINDVGRTFLLKGYSNNNFHNIYTNNNSKSIWLYLNSTISWLIQQLIMRSNLGDGAGKIEKYELADFPVTSVNLEDLEINLGSTNNFKDELGDLKSLKSVNPERLKLDTAILQSIGYKQKKERDEILFELYKSTYQLIEARLLKAQSQKTVKNHRNNVGLQVYVDQLNELLIEDNYSVKNNFTFAKQLEKLVFEITSESKLQKKILDAYWREKFGNPFNQKKIAQQDQISLF